MSKTIHTMRVVAITVTLLFIGRIAVEGAARIVGDCSTHVEEISIYINNIPCKDGKIIYVPVGDYPFDLYCCSGVPVDDVIHSTSGTADGETLNKTLSLKGWTSPPFDSNNPTEPWDLISWKGMGYFSEEQVQKTFTFHYEDAIYSKGQQITVRQNDCSVRVTPSSTNA